MGKTSASSALVMAQLAAGKITWEDAAIGAAWGVVGGASFAIAGKLVGKLITKLADARRAYAAAKGATNVEFKRFTYGNFRDNLKLLTGMDPPGNVQAHHVMSDKFEDFFERAGLNHNDPKYGAWWPFPNHQQNAHEYNVLWQGFIDNYPNATIAQIEEHGRSLARRFGLTIYF